MFFLIFACLTAAVKEDFNKRNNESDEKILSLF